MTQSNDRDVHRAKVLQEGPIATTMASELGAGALKHLRQYAPVDSSRPVVYLSTPITTGPLLLEWMAEQRRRGNPTPEPHDVEVIREEVVHENLARLVPLRRRVLAKEVEVHLIDPTTLEVEGWNQWEYHRFWVEVIESFVDRIIFADGWDLSTGCIVEYATGLELGIPMYAASGHAIEPTDAATKLAAAAARLRAAGRDPSVALDAASRAEWAANNPLKDAKVALLAKRNNVASFVSFSPGKPRLRYQVGPGPALSRSLGVRGAIERLLGAASGSSVNVRTFRPARAKGNPFHYGLHSVDEVLALVESLASEGYYCIVNETIDIHDGGVSGVILGGVAEFAPDDTPRAVEGPDAARMPVAMAERMLRTVYGDRVSLPASPGTRTEFSVHPMRVGQRREPVLIWEEESVEEIELHTEVWWPNRFSRLIGDKTFGLLVADALDVPVPTATAVTRRIAPFSFGRSPGTGEWWMRTAPAQQAPGHFTTTRGWSDPFRVLTKEDPDASVAAVLAQEGVDSIYSGATLPNSEGLGHTVEGVLGVGDTFMLGQRAAADLPVEIEKRVVALLRNIEQRLGAGVRIEWAADSDDVWVLQLHRTEVGAETGIFSVGHASTWLGFDPILGLDALTELIARAKKTGAGIEVIRPIGLTSHVGDLLRKARVPGRLAVRRTEVLDSE